MPDFAPNGLAGDVQVVSDNAAADFDLSGIHAAIRLENGWNGEGLSSLPFLRHFYRPVVSSKRWHDVGENHVKALGLPRLHSKTFAAGWMRWSSDKGIVLPPAAREVGFEHNFFLIEAASAGIGIAVTAWAYVESEIETGRLVAPWVFSPLQFRFHFIRPSRVDNAAAREFGNWLMVQGRRDRAPSEVSFRSGS
ncbi:hypothetical protein KX729_31190 [Rhizobium sp. XQZ8]|nr:hypothetical protein [Rhizobium populisoli]